ncbi:M20 metallopeptidase family protein [Sinomicrobium soli]|uniref:M20 metallopeptidase family protein n=1 Tax=Sinomicrobium sp. N-1-3-6 TaxID=2219864 RepID=UPI000DCCABE9|nr:M20 family metallopeptidase [Sinomicrobium sp. N-1-3-6]RAV29043.1 amidohydrolase [Sinomicrobium sp. N-1-3-6]
MLKEKIQSLAREIYGKTVAHRRHLHQHPELSFEEYETCAFVKAELDKLGIPYVTLARTGVLAEIKGDLPSDRVIALRADMDALPITEVDGREYGSENKGVMHACGHDAHTASLLGTAHILQSLKADFGGTLKLIFQPGEERPPGGASLMIEEGALENPVPRAVVGQHAMPLIPAGKVGFRPGKFMASTDEFFITVKGKGGHGAQPQQNTDPVVITAHIITALQQVVSRIADPRMPSVLSFGKVIANGATNVIPDEVYLEGTFRTFDEQWRKEARRRMKKMARGIAESMGAKCNFEVNTGYPVLVNEPKLTDEVRAYAEEFLGKEQVVDLDLWLAAEDFAYYSRAADSCFYLLGTGNESRGITSALHTSTFDVDESALQLSTGLMAYIALRQLGH